MPKTESLTGLRKRQQISMANKTVFAWIVAASIVVGVCGVVSELFVRQLFFNNTVIGALLTTNKNIEDNIKAYDGLREEVTKLVADTNLNALRKGENSTALQVIIDALPTEENRAALATSMQQEVLGPSGVSIDSFELVNNGGSAGVTPLVPAGGATAPQSFSFSFVLTGSYAQVQQAVRNMERSIRPLTIDTLELQGTDARLRATVSATTYYQTPKSVQLTQEKKPNEKK